MVQLSVFDRVITSMMSKFGTPATVMIASAGAYNYATSESEAVVDIEYTVKAIFMDLTLQGNGLSVQKDSLIQAGDKKVFIQPLNKTDSALSMPAPVPNKDRIAIGNKVYKIVTFKEVNPTMANSVVYECFIRE